LFVLNTKVLDRDYTKLDVPLKRLVPISLYGLTEDFYGGRVTHIGEIKDSKILLLIDNESDGLQIIDIAVENLEDLNCDILKQYAKSRHIEFDWRKVTKEEMIELIAPKTLVIQ